jgi:uncharacterized protein (TIGR01244 family)
MVRKIGFSPSRIQSRGLAFMRPIPLSDEIAVGEVPRAEEIPILAKAGFRSLLNAQPDGEVERFADAMVTRGAAEAVGLAYAHVPIESRLPSEEQIKIFSDALAALPRPIYAYCYSGGRAAAAWALSAVSTAPPSQVIQALEAAGYDASSLKLALERRHAGLSAFEATAPKTIATDGTNASVVGPALAPALAPALTVDPTAPSAVIPAQASATPAHPVPAKVLPRAASAGGFAVPG